MQGKNNLRLMLFLGIMAAMAPLATDMYLPALPTVQQDLGINASLAQLTLTMTLLGMALGQIVMGAVSDRFGRKRPLFLGMLGFMVANLGCVLAENIWCFLAFRFLAGFAGASGVVIARAIARDVAEGPALTRFFAMLMMVNGIAPIAAPVLGGQILLFSGWRTVFIILIAIGIMQAIFTLAFTETLPVAKRLNNMSAAFSKFPELLKNRYFLGHCLLQCVYFGSFFAYIAGSSFVFQNIYQVSPQVYSLIFGGVGIGLMIAGTLPARFAGRISDVTLLKISLVIPCIASLLLLGGFLCEAPMWYTTVLLFATIVPLSVMSSASFSLALSRQGKNAGSASALIGFFSMILGGCMMPVVGIAGDHTAVPMGIIMLAGYVLSIVCYWLMIRPDHVK